MNTRKGKSSFFLNCILLEIGCSSTILMGSLVKILSQEEDNPMQWHMQAGNITTNLKVKIYFTLPALSAMDIVTWNFHVDESGKGRYDMILVQDILTELGLNLKFSEHVIKEYGGKFKVSTTPMVDLGTYVFKYLNTGKITPEGSCQTR